jgi:hypothetical protein
VSDWYFDAEEIPCFHCLTRPLPHLQNATRFSTTKFKGKGKGNAHSATFHEGPEWSRGIAPVSLASALDEDSWSTRRPGRFTTGKDTRYPLHVHEPGWAPGLVWTRAETLAPTEIRSPDRLSRSESLCRLHCLGPQRQNLIEMDTREAKQWL